MREALFGALGSIGAIEGARVVDLYAGTGALGIEALSRGAAAATFVDDDPRSISVIRANLAGTGLEGTVVRDDVLRFLASNPGDVDLALVDPPYAFDEWERLLAALPAPLAALESGRSLDVGPGWEVVRARRYGDTVLTIVRRA